LFQTLYLPDPGVEQAPVGDELMEWLNIHFIEPSTEEGDHLSTLEFPWEEEGFWEYLTRFVNRQLLSIIQVSTLSWFYFYVFPGQRFVD
jgi:nuclear pore complex protein Nup85